ncbi:membrane protein [Lampropedia cohaerens]|uniref:Membrane protein n=1 Tax=Lampropedia cohaerens TaxID=1610491 RepID=A0A0U1Q233_9BURK|nr:membrane protein [Lampropedia cohaerens]KKW68819.1 membrane protein [Lampropedia cohaerens]
MHYGLLLLLHLLGAIVFAGTVFFEVVMLEGIRRHVPRVAMLQVERALGNRAVRIMPWALLVLYSAGLGMAWQHRAVLAQPWQSSFGILLTLKIALALSVFAHFVTAMVWRRRGVMTGSRSRRIHYSVFAHVLMIVVLAKAMIY